MPHHPTWLSDLEKAVVGAQVEAATGGQDVITFCGGLKAVLAAVGIPLHKALPSSLPPSCIDKTPHIQTDQHRDGDAAVTLAGGTEGLHLSQCLSSKEQGQQPEWTHGNLHSAEGGVAVLEGAQQSLAGSAKDQVSFGSVMLAASAQHVHSICPACAQLLPSMCTASAQHLPSICPACAQHVHSMCPACAQHLPSICTASALHLHTICAPICTASEELLQASRSNSHIVLHRLQHILLDRLAYLHMHMIHSDHLDMY